MRAGVIVALVVVLAALVARGLGERVGEPPRNPSPPDASKPGPPRLAATPTRTPNHEASTAGPASEPLVEVHISVELGSERVPPWAGASCHTYAAYFTTILPDELMIRGQAVRASTAEEQAIVDLTNTLLSVWAGAEHSPSAVQASVDRLRTLTPPCAPTCAPASIVAHLVLHAFHSESAPPPDLVVEAARHLRESPDHPMWPLLVRTVEQSRPDLLIPLLTSPAPGLREDAAMRLACHDELMQSLPGDTLALLESSMPDHPETLALPVASRWNALGRPDLAANALSRLEDFVERPAARPECIDEAAPPPVPIDGGGLAIAVAASMECSMRLDSLFALVDALPLGSSDLQTRPEAALRAAVRACAPACGTVRGRWEEGEWTSWTGWRKVVVPGAPFPIDRPSEVPPRLGACVRNAVESVPIEPIGARVVHLSVSGDACPL